MSTRRRRPVAQGQIAIRLVLGLVALLTCLWSYAIPAHALPAPQVASCAGVWVVVDYGALGGTTTACAGSYTTGMTALRSRFTVILDAGMVVRITGLPTTPNTQENYWSYWHATRQADGSYSSWSYSSVGPGAYHPSPGVAEGWRYEPVSGGNVAPGVLPPQQTATTQAPATPAAAPVTTARTTVTTRPPTTKAATVATTPTPTGTTPDLPATATSPGQAETPVVSEVPSDPESDVAVGSTVQPTSATTSSLYGGVGAISAIALGAAVMLVWRKRRAATG